jgi:hypothetical protein
VIVPTFEETWRAAAAITLNVGAYYLIFLMMMLAIKPKKRG